MIAAYRKREEVVKFLAKAGADTMSIVTRQSGVGSATAAGVSRLRGASTKQQTAYLEAKMLCSSPDCSGRDIMIIKCTGCRHARYCGEPCQLAH
jgi:hypothetical protein